MSITSVMLPTPRGNDEYFPERAAHRGPDGRLSQAASGRAGARSAFLAAGRTGPANTGLLWHPPPGAPAGGSAGRKHVLRFGELRGPGTPVATDGRATTPSRIHAGFSRVVGQRAATGPQGPTANRTAADPVRTPGDRVR
ncbi:hypothetical protein [Ktedonospora formicarum]|uniref:hypothetical protein n=1 Tax=Ktedonospora formicarum TaxID=2778364 RepID=UPI001C687A5D|nr:hypothetical protein [Ktedonospora formicarum]